MIIPTHVLSVIAVGKQVSKLEHAPFLGNPIFDSTSAAAAVNFTLY